MMSYKLFVLALLCVLCNAEEVKKEVKEVKTDDALIKEVAPKPDMEVADKVVPIPDEKVEAEPEFIEEGLDDEFLEEDEDIPRPVEDVPEEEKEENMPVPVEEAPEEEKFEDEIVKEEEEEEEVAVPDQDQPAEDPRTIHRITIHFRSRGTIGRCPSTNPYAFNGGRHCCASRREGTSWPVKSTCNGNLLSTTSTCCSKNKFVKCAHTKCKSRVLFLQTNKACAIPLNEHQCKAVAKSMPQVKWDTVSWFTRRFRPSGCYAKVDSKNNIEEVVWNKSKSGRSCNKERMCICRRF